MKRPGGLSIFFLLLFGSALLLSSAMVRHITAEGDAEEAAFQELAEAVRVEKPVREETAADQESPQLDEAPSPYAAIKEQNPDFFGWLSIDGTELSYPVMHTPEEPEYYLRRNFERERAESGVPFLAGNCYEGCGNYLIYGHNMKNGSMSAALLFYAEPEYWEQHPTIQLDTLNGAKEYQVMAAFYSKVYQRGEENVFRFYQYGELTSESVFADYVEQVRNQSLYDTGICAEYGDQLLTLVTCSYHTGNGRFVVVARKQAEK